MKQRFSARTIHFSIFLLLCGLLNSAVCAQESNRPFSINESPLGAPTSPVMDYAGVIDQATKEAIEKKIIAFRDSTNPKVELAVAIVETTGERPIFDYSLAVSRGWKIGSPEQDNPGALLFIAVKDRKYFTQVSKDLEDELPDGLVGQLQRQNLVPAFRQQNYGKGVSDTIDAYISTIRAKQNGETPPAGTTQPVQQKKSSFSLTSIFCCLIIVFLLVLPLISFLGRKKKGGGDDNWRGGGFGGGTSDALPWIIGSVIANSIGNSSSSSSSDWGSSSSGGSDWGGFGGGGDFGGGGAGGDW